MPTNLDVAFLNTDQAPLSHETCRGTGPRLVAKCTLRNKKISAVKVADTPVFQLSVVLIAPPRLRIHSSIIRSCYHRSISGHITYGLLPQPSQRAIKLQIITLNCRNQCPTCSMKKVKNKCIWSETRMGKYHLGDHGLDRSVIKI